MLQVSFNSRGWELLSTKSSELLFPAFDIFCIPILWNKFTVRSTNIYVAYLTVNKMLPRYIQLKTDKIHVINTSDPLGKESEGRKCFSFRAVPHTLHPLPHPFQMGLDMQESKQKSQNSSTL